MRPAIFVWWVCALLLCVGVVSLGIVSAASASEGSQLAISRFTFQTTRAVQTPMTHESYGFVNESVPYTQAGGHLSGLDGGADALSTLIEFETETVTTPLGPVQVPTQDPRDIAVDVPPGLLGNPTATPRCPLKEALSLAERCPASTQIGVAVLHLIKGEGFVGPIVNVVPEAGQTAEFAIDTPSNVNFLLTGHVVHGPEGYGLSVTSNGTPNTQLTAVETTFWGVPASKIHDPERGLYCERGTAASTKWTCGAFDGSTDEDYGSGGESSGVAEEVPFLTMPAGCASGPEVASVRADSWEEPVRYVDGRMVEGRYARATTTIPGATGCDLLRFDAGIEVEPNTLLADEPVGLGVSLSIAQYEEPQRLATPELREAVVTLPLGVSISPGIVDGIQACEASGPEGINFEGPESEEVGLDGELQLAAGHCPDASTVGTAKALTPLLSEPVEGHVYLARPGCGGAGQAPCTEQDALDGNLYKLYLELGGTGPLAITGVHLKVEGRVEANPATGQLTARFQDNPQLPFSRLEVDLNPGPRAPIDNPATCGPATTTADFTPWAAPGRTPQGVSTAGVADTTPSSFFEVNGCESPSGLAPGFVAGTVIPNAGKFSEFTVDISRKDREQDIKGVQIHTPPGLLGMLANVPLCEEPQADSGHCPESSKIGTTRVASGAGSHPFEIEGNVYLTGPYRGAPFGLSVVTDAVAGPFNLGLVVVRARIDVDPENSTLTVTTDETGPYALPQIVDGVPLRLQRIAVDIDRQDFMFNPTDCGAPGSPGAQQVTARISGAGNAVASVRSQFAVGGCQSLAFKPSFVVSTSGHTSRADGASLDLKVTYPQGAQGTEADFAKVKVELPRQLPSRLGTLQKACTATQFDANPAGCPAASVIGTVRVSTPLLPVELTGPAYFVSHGGEAFPSLIMVLEGDGVRVDVVGSTFISKSSGITSSTLKNVPDVPFNSFELYLPEGPYSALAAIGDLCGPTTATVKREITKRVRGRVEHATVTTRTLEPTSLTMPSEFIAQNGAVLKQDTKVGVTGCPPTRAADNRKSMTRPQKVKAKKAVAMAGKRGTR